MSLQPHAADDDDENDISSGGGGYPHSPVDPHPPPDVGPHVRIDVASLPIPRVRPSSDSPPPMQEVGENGVVPVPHGVRWDDLPPYNTQFAPPPLHRMDDIDAPDATQSIATEVTAASARPPLSSAPTDASSVSVDLTVPHSTTSVDATHGEASATNAADGGGGAVAAASSSQQHLTARERLVERERQSRLERQRAQVKRRIAMNREAEEMELARVGIDLEQQQMDDDEDGDSDRGMLSRRGDLVGEGGSSDAQQRLEALDELAGRDGSIVGTVGDASTHGGDVEHHDHEYDDDDDDDGIIDDHGIEDGIDDNGPPTPGGGGGGGGGGVEGEQGGLALGYAMERFLSEQVLVTESDQQGGAEHIDDDIENVPSDASGEAMMPETVDVVDVDDSEPDVGLPFPPNSTSSVPSVGVSYPPNSTASFPPNSIASIQSADLPREGSLDGQLLPSPPVRAGSYDLSTSVRSDDGIDDTRDSTNADFAPRLARLTEADVLEMNDIDYASVGNVPPRSVRDEDDPLLRMSFTDEIGASISGTHTTVVETVSIPSGRSTSGGERRSTPSMHSEAHEEGSALLAMSPVVASDEDIRVGAQNEDTNIAIVPSGTTSPFAINDNNVPGPHESSLQLRAGALPHSTSPSLLGNADDLEAPDMIEEADTFNGHNGYAHHVDGVPPGAVNVTSPAVATLGEFVEDEMESPDRLACPLLDQHDYHDYGATNGIANGDITFNGDGEIPREVLLEKKESTDHASFRRTNEAMDTTTKYSWFKSEIGPAWVAIAFCIGLAIGLFLR